MNVLKLTPHPNYLTKLLASSLIGSIVLFWGMAIPVVAMALVSKEGYGVLALGGGILIFLIITALSLFFVNKYYESIRYEIHDEEIIVYSGFINQSVKHVNFRNITNMELKRSLLDRWLGIGSLSVQTAGSGTAMPEEKLAGLDNVTKVYQLLAEQLREYRSETPISRSTSSSVDMRDSQDILTNREISIQILRELRAIRTLLSQ